MNDNRLLLVGELLFDPSLSFEACAELEEELRTLLRDRATALGAPFLDVAATGEGLRFEASPPPADTAEIRNFCCDLAAALAPGVTGRVLALRHGLGHIDLLYLTSQGVTDIPVPRP